MPYARINMAEFTSSAEAERTIAILRNDIKSVFPEIRAFACVETTETSALTISIYDDKEADHDFVWLRFGKLKRRHENEL